MSKFQTTITVDLKAVLDQLPERSFVNGILFDGENVIVHWENDDYTTPYTFPLEWDPKQGELPQHVTKGARAPVSPTKPVNKGGAQRNLSRQQPGSTATPVAKGTKDAGVQATAAMKPKTPTPKA